MSPEEQVLVAPPAWCLPKPGRDDGAVSRAGLSFVGCRGARSVAVLSALPALPVEGTLGSGRRQWRRVKALIPVARTALTSHSPPC